MAETVPGLQPSPTAGTRGAAAILEPGQTWLHDRYMVHPAGDSVWETWESVFLKTTALGDRIIERTLTRGQHITRIAFVPRGGLYMANILSRMLGLTGDQTISLGISKYDRERPMQAGNFKIGQLPDASQVGGQVVLLVDEVHDSGRTAEWARNALAELGAATVLMAVIHYKPGANATGYEPDFYIEATSGWVHYPWEPIDLLGSIYQAALRAQAE